jgi:predicted nucleic acid-binding Zn ribbon protein
MFEESFSVCPICRKTLTSDADIQAKVARYCRLCGMHIEGFGRFCCYKCEGMFKRFVEKKKEVKKWKNQSYRKRL